ncbi:MAG: winged helix DNA-binding domain-containing protein [Actinomycetota bacterium]|nr:winged helix DNA-binding domain-containing protein [Actinomycetota bacterium]
MKRLSEAQVRALWWRAQLLEPRHTLNDPAGIVRSVGAIQSQEPPAAALALRARGGGFDAAEAERVRVEDRSVVRTWCQRGTIHLVATEDINWILEVLRETLIAARASRWRNLELDETTYEEARRSLRKALADGPLTRAEIGERWQASGIHVAGQRLPHLISRAAIDGEICDGPDHGRDRTWVRLEDWVEPRSGPQGQQALAELARRHLVGHGPAEPRDLAVWSGLKVSDARAGWAQIADELEELETPWGLRWTLARKERKRQLEPGANSGVVRLLGAFDAYLLGYKDREPAVPPPHTKAVSGSANLRVAAAAAVDGVVVGTWRMDKRAGALEIRVAPFEELDTSVFADEVEDIGRFLGRPARLV